MGSLQFGSGGSSVPDAEREAALERLSWDDLPGLEGLEGLEDIDPQYRASYNVWRRWRLYELADPPRDLVGEALETLDGFNLPANFTMLELGCGSGEDIVRVRKMYPEANLFALDPSAAYAAAEAEVKDNGLNRILFMPKKAEDHLPVVPDSSVNVVAFFNSIYECDNPEEILKHTHRILKPDGKVILSDFDDTNKPNHRFFEAQGGEVLGIEKPRVNHEAFNSKLAKKILPLYFDLIDAVPPQRSYVRIKTEEGVQIYVGSLDAYREKYDPYPFPGQSAKWYRFLDKVVANTIRAEIRRKGVFEDFVARDVFIGTPRQDLAA